MIDNDNLDERFSSLASLIGEKARAKMLWHLLSGRAYTALELAVFADISKQSCSNHLKKLVGEKILKSEKQGRHKYFRLYDKQVANALEGMAFLISKDDDKEILKDNDANRLGIRFARSCYDHLAGYVGVEIQNSLINQGLILLTGNGYKCSEKGMEKFRALGIEVNELHVLKRKFAYPCLDWSERKHHIGGALGASLLQYMISNDWLRKKKDTRELILTSKGHQALVHNFKLNIQL